MMQAPMPEETDQPPGNEPTETPNPLSAVRYSLPAMLDEIARDRESVREGGNLLSQDQITAMFAAWREKEKEKNGPR